MGQPKMESGTNLLICENVGLTNNCHKLGQVIQYYKYYSARYHKKISKQDYNIMIKHNSHIFGGNASKTCQCGYNLQI